MREFAVPLLLVLAFGAAAQTASPAASADEELLRIQTERQRVQDRFAVAEPECYRRFAVTDCLIALRANRREALADLRRQEVSVNDEQRKRSSAAQLTRLAQRADQAALPETAERRANNQQAFEARQKEAQQAQAAKAAKAASSPGMAASVPALP